MFILIYYLYNRYKGQICSKGIHTMAQQNTKVVKSSINHESPIITSDTNNELKKRIKDISQEVLKRNYELYKALENK